MCLKGRLVVSPWGHLTFHGAPSLQPPAWGLNQIKPLVLTGLSRRCNLQPGTFPSEPFPALDPCPVWAEMDQAGGSGCRAWRWLCFAPGIFCSLSHLAEWQQGGTARGWNPSHVPELRETCTGSSLSDCWGNSQSEIFGEGLLAVDKRVEVPVVFSAGSETCVRSGLSGK